MQNQLSKFERITGLFIFIVLGLIVAFLVLNIKEGKLFSKRIILETRIDKGHGVSKGTLVKVNGLTAGMVESMRLDKDNSVWVTMKISYPFYENIHKDAVAQIIEPIAFGSTEINILTGSNDKPVVADGEFIASSTPENITTRLEEGFKKVEDTINEVRKTVENINKAAENLESITRKANQGEGTIGKLVNESGLYDSAKQAVDSTHSLGASFQELEAIIKEGREVAAKVDKIAANLESITTKIDKGEGSVGKMLNDSGLYDSAKDAVDSTRSIVDSIKQTKIFVGLDGFSYDEYTSTRFHLKVVPRETRYFWLGASILNPTGDTDITMDTADTNGKVVPEFIVAQKLFEQRITLRGGLMEGRFGGGIDYSPIPKAKDILTLTLEGRKTFDTEDFNENLEDPIVRAKFRLKFLNYFHIEMGQDDLLNDPGFFVGIGFEYMDEDISKIVGLIGAGK